MTRIAPLLLIAFASLAPPATAGAPARHALLVGVSTYANLGESFHLAGPANDVLLMRDLLKKQFAFADSDIAILAEHQGKDRLPTRANIAQEFRRVAEVAKPGDQVVIFLAGHGSQQPQGPNPPDPEPDGLDELFLPRDVGGWDGKKGTVANAIIDDEIGDWLKAITKKRAAVWTVFDCCHSGTLARTLERSRELKPDEALGVPKAALDKARQEAAARPGDKARGLPAGDRSRERLGETGGLVALYACQAHEITVEQDLPAGATDARPCGLLTYTLCQVLTQSAKDGAKPPTYRELTQLINKRYANLGRSFPTPQLEGKNELRDREVLGTKTWAGRSALQLARDKDGWKVNAGALHGLTEGSVLAVYPPIDAKNADRLSGHVKVTRLNTLSARVEPCEYDKQPAPAVLPANGRCDPVHLDYGVHKLRIAAAPDSLGEADRLIAALGKEMPAAAEKAANADWLLKPTPGGVLLFRHSDWGTKNAGFGPFSAKNDELKNALARIARAEGLKQLATSSAGERAGDAVKLDVEVLRFKNEADRQGKVVPWDSAGRVVHSGDLVSLRLRNPCPHHVDVTVLYIDSDYGITPWFPDPDAGEINRLEAGKSLVLGAKEINADTVGLENILIIAVKGTAKQRTDLTLLAQPTLAKARAVAGGPSVLDSPLGKLLATSAYGAGGSRGISRPAAAAFAMQLLPWRVVGTTRAKE